jgi:hypothetical protein
VYDVPFVVNFDEARGGHFVETHAIGVDEILIIGTWNSHCEMILDAIIPSEVRNDAVSHGQLHAQLCLRRSDFDTACRLHAVFLARVVV